jgi:hypothetical protein
MLRAAPMSVRDEVLEIQLSPGGGDTVISRRSFHWMLDQRTSSTNTVALFPRTSV